MPTREHEAPILLLRERPELAAEILRDLLDVPIPPHTEARVESADFTKIFPVQFHADLVMTLRREGQPVMGIICEVQRSEDPDKRTAWPFYAAALHAQLRCQIALAVIADDERIAQWAAKPITTMQVGSSFVPLVLGPSRVPMVTSVEEALRAVELSVLSTLVHGKKSGLAVGRPALHATTERDLSSAQRTLYLDLILSALGAEDRATLEGEMDLTGYKFKSETFRKLMAEEVAEGFKQGEARGEANAVLAFLEARGLPIGDDARSRILACIDLSILERWIRRAATVASVDELFQDG